MKKVLMSIVSLVALFFMVQTADAATKYKITEASAVGVVKYVSLEGGFYTVGDYVITNPSKDLKSAVGKNVVVKGILLPAGFSSTMSGKKMLEMDTLTIPNSTVLGVVKYVALEGGFYTVGNYIVSGPSASLKAAVGKEIFAKGSIISGGASIYGSGKGRVEISSFSIMSPISLPTPVTKAEVKGTVTFNPLEGGFYMLGNYVIETPSADIKKAVGKTIIAVGVIQKIEVSKYMVGKERIKIESFKLAPVVTVKYKR